MVRQAKPTGSSTDSLKKEVEPENTPDSYKWKSFASNTTLHGLRYVCHNGKSFWKRAIWLMFLCASTGAYMYFVSVSLRKYLSLPIKTTISLETPTNGLTFPAVTVCNLNKLMRSKIDVPDKDKRFEKLGLNINGCKETRAVRGNLTCGQALTCAFQWFGPALIKGCNETTRRNIINALNSSSERSFNTEEFYIKYGNDIRSMFVGFCRFGTEILCSDKDFVPRLTPNGICFTFNSGQNNATLFHSMFAGPDFGLSILLDVQANESTISEFSTGFEVIVHGQNAFVNRHSGFNVGPGSHARVAVKLKKLIRLPAPYQTNCLQTPLSGIGEYTKDGCHFQCISNATIKQCGCRRPGMPGPRSLPVCSIKDQSCVKKSQSPRSLPVCSIKDQSCVKKSQREVNIKACSCSSACSEFFYEPHVSYSRFPDIAGIKILQHYFGKTESSSYMRDNYVLLQVGFQHLTYEKHEDVPSYGAESLFGEFGGNMGLFLGCSLLTICEFFDFLWDATTSWMKKRSTNVNTGPLTS